MVERIPKKKPIGAVQLYVEDLRYINSLLKNVKKVSVEARDTVIYGDNLSEVEEELRGQIFDNIKFEMQTREGAYFKVSSLGASIFLPRRKRLKYQLESFLRQKAATGSRSRIGFFYNESLPNNGEGRKSWANNPWMVTIFGTIVASLILFYIFGI